MSAHKPLRPLRTNEERGKFGLHHDACDLDTDIVRRTLLDACDEIDWWAQENADLRARLAEVEADSEHRHRMYVEERARAIERGARLAAAERQIHATQQRASEYANRLAAVEAERDGWEREHEAALKEWGRAERRLAAIDALCDDSTFNMVSAHEVRAVARGEGDRPAGHGFSNWRSDDDRCDVLVPHVSGVPKLCALPVDHPIHSEEGDRPAERHAYETAWKGEPGSEAGCTKPGRWGNCGEPRSAPVHYQRDPRLFGTETYLP